MVWWVPLAVAGVQMAMQASQGSRSASSEIPGIAELMAQSVSGRRDAQVFSRAAADPSSPWFEGVAGVLEEDLINSAFRALREKDIRDMRKIGRGIPISMVTNPERRDESKTAAWIDALQRAKLRANTLTPQILLNAAQSSAGSATVPSGIMQLFAGYGSANAQRTTDLIQGGGALLQNIYKQWPSSSGSTSPDYSGSGGTGGDFGIM